MGRISFLEAPAFSSLFVDFLANRPELRRFFPHGYSIESIAQFARQRPKMDDSHLDSLCSALRDQHRRWGVGSGGSAGIDRLNAGAVAVVTGQQPGLFTGPMYSIYKAISSIKVAESLEEIGIPAVPVFWIAAEDHDQEEIREATVLNPDSVLCPIRAELSGAEAAPVGWTQYSESIRDTTEQCLKNLPQSEYLPEVRDLLESAYSAGLSPVDSFGRMMSKLFRESDLVLVNPLQPELKRLAAPTILEVVRRNPEVRAAVIERTRWVVEAGYHEQVRVDENFTGLFAYNGKSRQALKPAELGTGLPLSPNVLLRPVVQDSLFPTAAYIGGPAEIAYFAQASAIYDVLGRPTPPVLPRISASLLEPRIARTLQKYGLEVVDVYRGRDFIRRKAVERVQDVLEFDRVRTAVAEAMESLGPVLSSVDPTLAGALDTSRQKMLHQIEALRTRFLNAQMKRNEVMDRQLDAVGNSLFPEKKLQERVINVTSFLARFGLGFVDRLQRQLTLDITQHQIVEIA